MAGLWRVQDGSIFYFVGIMNKLITGHHFVTATRFGCRQDNALMDSDTAREALQFSAPRSDCPMGSLAWFYKEVPDDPNNRGW